MYKVNSNTAPVAFHGISKRARQKYPIGFTKCDYGKPNINLIKNRFRVFFRGPLYGTPF